MMDPSEIDPTSTYVPESANETATGRLVVEVQWLIQNVYQLTSVAAMQIAGYGGSGTFGWKLSVWSNYTLECGQILMYAAENYLGYGMIPPEVDEWWTRLNMYNQKYGNPFYGFLSSC